jgi:RNA polymerase sigma-70 factor, ECF subfamily
VSVSKTGNIAFERAELEELLRRSGAGDRKAFTALYGKTASKLFGIIRRICASEEIAQEALQECYVLIWKNAGTYDPRLAAPLTWMARIARNKAIDIRRLQSERIAALGVELVVEAASPEAGPLAEAEKNDELRRLADCLKALGEEGREMILLAYRDGLSREELGVRFGRPVNTVKTLLRRGLAQLKDCLGSHD